MPRRALLIASQIHGLRGCEGDVALMQELLKERGFTCATVTTADATRAGILAAFDELINVTIEDDIVVVYYSGHGGRMPHPEWQKRRDEGQPAHLQFILPSDIEGSTEENFRGLLAEEITALQRRLTDRTQNVTTILDCCHSAYMARDVDLMPKATTRSFPVLGAVARLRTIPPIPLRHGTDTNDIAIRIVACHPEQSAYERTTPLLPRSSRRAY